MAVFDSLSPTTIALIPGTVATYAPNTVTPPSARSVALKQLFDYIAELTFYRADRNGRSIAFQIHRHAMYEEWPDNEVELELPCLAIVPGKGEYIATGFGPWEDLSTFNTYGEGTVVQALGTDFSELMMLEVWGASKGERRAVLTGMEAAFSPIEDQFGLKLKLPNYYDEIAYFTPNSSSIVDDANSARNRRVGRMEVLFRIPLLRLITAVKMDNRVVVQVTVQTGVEAC